MDFLGDLDIDPTHIVVGIGLFLLTSYLWSRGEKRREEIPKLIDSQTVDLTRTGPNVYSTKGNLVIKQ